MKTNTCLTNSSLLGELSVLIILLVLLNSGVKAQPYGGRPQYVFPPLEEAQDTARSERQTYQPADYRNSVQSRQNSFFNQPRYIFPELENQQQKPSYSKYNYPSEAETIKQEQSAASQQIESYQNKGDNTFSRSEQDFRNNQSSSYTQPYYQGSGGRLSPYGTSPFTNNTQPFNGFPSPMSNSFFPGNNFFTTPGFGNNNFGSPAFGNGFGNGVGNNSWNPFSNSQSIWPGSMNRSYDSNSIYNPGIRIPGFFSR